MIYQRPIPFTGHLRIIENMLQDIFKASDAIEAQTCTLLLQEYLIIESSAKTYRRTVKRCQADQNAPHYADIMKRVFLESKYKLRDLNHIPTILQKKELKILQRIKQYALKKKNFFFRN